MEAVAMEGPGMYGDMMRYVAGQQRDGAVDRPEFKPDFSTQGWPAVADDDVRKRVESFVVKHIPEAHKFADSSGSTRVIYLDERGRSVDCFIEEVPDSELVRMARRYGMRFGGDGRGDGQYQPKPGMSPDTSRTDHGYSKPATEDADGAFEDALHERASKMNTGKWKVDGDGKDLANEDAAIKAAATMSAFSGGKPIKVWQQPDVVAGVKGNRGYSVSVKSISRKGLAG